MIELHGPTYRYTGETLAQPEVILVRDHHYNENDRRYHLKSLLENSTCDPYDHVLVLESVLCHDDELKDYNIVICPLFMARQVKLFNNENIEPNWSKRNHCFNFMINKPRLHREFLLILIEHFKLTNYTYTLCWEKPEIARGPLERLSEKYAPMITNTPVNISSRQFLLGQENLLDRGLQYRHIENSENYRRFLQKEVFEPSCISIITEPAFFEKETVFSEKTLMSIYSGTLPLWVGGWRCADSLRKLGFDVFDDVVDHSYQNMSDPFDRCYYAIERNLDLLRNFERVNNFIQSNQSRFEHNLQLLRTNVFQQAVDRVDLENLL